MVFQCEKALADFGDKVSEEEKANIQSKIDALKAANATDNTDASLPPLSPEAPPPMPAALSC